MPSFPIGTEAASKEATVRKCAIIALAYAFLSFLLFVAFLWGTGLVQMRSNYRTVVEALLHGEDLAYIPLLVCAVLAFSTFVLSFIYSIRGALATCWDEPGAWGWVARILLVLLALLVIFFVFPAVAGFLVTAAIALF